MKLVIEGRSLRGEHAGLVARDIIIPSAVIPCILEVSAKSDKEADEFIEIVNSNLEYGYNSQYTRMH